MHQEIPSRTALRVALRRAAHQMHDAKPLVFDDPLAVRILGPEFQEELKRTPDAANKPYSAGMRGWMVTRARLAEDTLATAVREPQLGGRAARQYLVLGAGLDTFACRNPFADVRVFEVDHPATQAWKLEKLASAGIVPPPSAHFVAVDFERVASGLESRTLRERLREADFDESLQTVTAWLGVVPYLTLGAFRATVALLGQFARGSEAVFDYAQPREVLAPREQLMQDSLRSRVALAGEPFQLFFTPEQLAEELGRAGMRVVEDLDGAALTKRYLAERTDGLILRGGAGRVCVAASQGLASASTEMRD